VIFHLKHAKAEEMAKLLKAEEMAKLLAGRLATENARVSLGVDSRTNSLVFQGPPEAAKLVEALLLKFDRAESEPERVLHVFQLKYAEAQEVAKVLTGTLEAKNARWSVDGRRNCVVLYGTPEAAALAKNLISELDRPAAPREPDAEMRTRVYQVKHADVSLVFQVLETMLAGQRARMAVDKKTNSVVIAAPEDVLNSAAELIQTLDVPEAARRGARPGAPCQFRIVWLASGLSSKDAPAPADDLKQVVEQLAGLGVKDVRQVGQMVMVVNAPAERPFTMQCSPVFEGATAELRVDGVLDVKTESPQLSLRIAAKQRRPITVGVAAPPDAAGGFAGDTVNLVNLDTMISPRFDGSYVVLGVAPVGKVTSIFVVQATQRPER
jgi:type II secretory pathway component GspD/PulD (secretin)